jgi:hypothetical protein
MPGFGPRHGEFESGLGEGLSVHKNQRVQTESSREEFGKAVIGGDFCARVIVGENSRTRESSLGECDSSSLA